MIPLNILQIVERALLINKQGSNAVAIYIEGELKQYFEQDTFLLSQVFAYLLHKNKRWPIEVGLCLVEYSKNNIATQEAKKFLLSPRGKELIAKHEGIAISANRIFSN